MLPMKENRGRSKETRGEGGSTMNWVRTNGRTIHKTRRAATVLPSSWRAKKKQPENPRTGNNQRDRSAAINGSIPAAEEIPANMNSQTKKRFGKPTSGRKAALAKSSGSPES